MTFTVCMTSHVSASRSRTARARRPGPGGRPRSASRRAATTPFRWPADTGSAVDSGLEPGDEISADDLASLLEDALAQGKEAGSASVSFEAGSSEKTGLSGEGVVAYADETVEADFTVESGLLGGSAEVRLVDGVLYAKVPMFGDKFFEIDPDDPASPLGAMLGGELGGELDAHPDLESMFDGLEGAISEATYVGEDDVQGESLSHYSVEIDPAELVDGAEQPGPARRRQHAGRSTSGSTARTTSARSSSTRSTVGTVELTPLGLGRRRRDRGAARGPGDPVLGDVRGLTDRRRLAAAQVAAHALHAGRHRSLGDRDVGALGVERLEPVEDVGELGPA